MSKPSSSAAGRRLPAELELDVGLDEAEDETALRGLAARRLGIPVADLPALVLHKRSIDARRGKVRFHWVVGFAGGAAPEASLELKAGEGAARVVVVGAGPCGLFCAYELARHGVRSIIVDRGKPVQPRRHDLKALNQRGVVDPDSNYCFGEGGAGTYSDGKLYTRSHKRGNVRDVLRILTNAGAPSEILLDARPHIGSNRLPKVVTAIRQQLEAVGTEFRFGKKLVDVGVEGTMGDRRATGIRLSDGSEIAAEAVVLATGHSARDVFELLLRLGLVLEPKSFALGVRIEHPQPLINRIQYGPHAAHPKLPNAAYRLAETIDERGVFSFCMCPGGWIVPAATEASGLVVNGMSLSRRSSPHANSGLVVSIEPEDLARAGFSGPLSGVFFQRALETAAFEAGGGELRAPATRATDFVRGRGSSRVPESSYIPGIVGADLRAVLDSAGVLLAARLGRALERFGRRLPGYLTEEAVLVGVESRTSAPLRVVRDPNSLEAIGLSGLYPAGEGAGHAGGIVSAALDGIRTAHAVLQRLGAPRH